MICFSFGSHATFNQLAREALLKHADRDERGGRGARRGTKQRHQRTVFGGDQLGAELQNTSVSLSGLMI